MSELLISNIFTDEFSDVVTTEVLKDYYETMMDLDREATKDLSAGDETEETNHNVEVMNALTVLLKEFMAPDLFEEWLKERT
jgi:hypothetical protein|tara:strand:- start:850 stop:1095 length:246 start_codon:yes stop_codon:yes gene_type:complete